MLSEDLLAILVCPTCKTKVNLIADKWLACQNPQCRRKYPIQDGIPVMLEAEARRLTEAWREDYNRLRPHSALGNRTPIEFARNSAGHAPLNSLVR